MPSAKSVPGEQDAPGAGGPLIKEEAYGRRFSVDPRAKTKRKAPADPVAVDSKH